MHFISSDVEQELHFDLFSSFGLITCAPIIKLQISALTIIYNSTRCTTRNFWSFKDSKENSNSSRDSALISTSQLVNAKVRVDNTVPSMVNFMLRDTTTPAFTSIWETVSMASTASSPTPSKDKLSSPNLPKMFAENYITKTTAPKEANANFPTTSETNLVFSTLWESANSQMESVAFPTKRKWR